MGPPHPRHSSVHDTPGHRGTPEGVPGRHPGAAGWAPLGLPHTHWPEHLLKLPLEGHREFLQDTLYQPRP